MMMYGDDDNERSDEGYTQENRKREDHQKENGS